MQVFVAGGGEGDGDDGKEVSLGEGDTSSC